jgi:hypothetical protein
MKYFKLNPGATQWIETEKDEKARQIDLFDLVDGEMIFKGIGQY